MTEVGSARAMFLDKLAAIAIRLPAPSAQNENVPADGPAGATSPLEEQLALVAGQAMFPAKVLADVCCEPNGPAGAPPHLLMGDTQPAQYLVLYPNIVSDLLKGKPGPTGRSSFRVVSRLNELSGSHANRAGAINLGSVRKAINDAVALTTK